MEKEKIKYPTLKAVSRASIEKLRYWYANLPTAETESERNVLALIYKRLIRPA